MTQDKKRPKRPLSERAREGIRRRRRNARAAAKLRRAPLPGTIFLALVQNGRERPLYRLLFTRKTPNTHLSRRATYRPGETATVITEAYVNEVAVFHSRLVRILSPYAFQDENHKEFWFRLTLNQVGMLTQYLANHNLTGGLEK